MSKTNLRRANDILRQLLRQLRVAKNLSQAEVADRLALPQSYVSKYETGERRLDFGETVLICEALDLTLEELTAAFTIRLRKEAGTKNRVRDEAI